MKLGTGTTDYSTCQNHVMTTNMSAFILLNVFLCRPIYICVCVCSPELLYHPGDPMLKVHNFMAQ